MRGGFLKNPLLLNKKWDFLKLVFKSGIFRKLWPYPRQQHNREIEGKIIGIQKKNATTRFANHAGSEFDLDQLWRTETFRKISLVLYMFFQYKK